MTPPKKKPARKAAPKRRPTPTGAVTSGDPQSVIEVDAPATEPFAIEGDPQQPTPEQLAAAQELGSMVLSLDGKILTLLRDTFDVVLRGGEVTIKRTR